MRGNGERIGPQNLPTSSIAGGIWNLLNQQRAQQRGAWPSAAPAVVTDPYFMYVPLLLNTTSTNGQQNNTFLDSSTNNFTITRNGTPTQGSFTPYQPSGYWSGYFSSSYLSVADSASLRFGSGNFTIEAWVFRTASGTTHTIACKGASTPTGWVFQISSADKLVFIDTSTSITGSTSIPANTWTYVAVVRAGTGASQTTLYVNGASDGTGTSGTTFSQTDAMRIATDRSAANSFAGYISNLRLSNTNLSISNQTAPLSVIGSTIFYSLGYNRFVDGSTLASAITVGSGTPQVQAFQPFSPAASYSAATYGGSGYFGGSASDYLSVADNAAFTLGTNSFTIEAYIYPTSLPSSGSISNIAAQWVTTTSNQAWLFALYNNGGVMQLLWQPTSGTTQTVISQSYAFAVNNWYHVAIVKNGSAVTLYVNGTALGSATTYSSSINDSTANLTIGIRGSLDLPFAGYISNFRIVNGTAIAPPAGGPTLPVTAVSGTSLLTNFTNAGIYDAAWQNNALTVGDAQASTTQYKWSPTSMKFDGTGDWLTAIDSPGLQLGSGDFTIEGWVYLSATGVAYGLISKGTASTGWSVNVTSGNKLQFSYTSSNLTGATSLSASTWYYFAVVRSGTATGNLKVYLNGTADATSGGAVTDNFNQTSTFYTGADRIGGSALNGYLQDIRLTKGYARTVTTTPTAAFPTR